MGQYPPQSPGSLAAVSFADAGATGSQPQIDAKPARRNPSVIAGLLIVLVGVIGGGGSGIALRHRAVVHAAPVATMAAAAEAPPAEEPATIELDEPTPVFDLHAPVPVDSLAPASPKKRGKGRSKAARAQASAAVQTAAPPPAPVAKQAPPPPPVVVAKQAPPPPPVVKAPPPPVVSPPPPVVKAAPPVAKDDEAKVAASLALEPIENKTTKAATPAKKTISRDPEADKVLKEAMGATANSL